MYLNIVYASAFCPKQPTLFSSHENIMLHKSLCANKYVMDR